MSMTLKKHVAQLCAATLAISSLATVNASAAEPNVQMTAVLSANLNTTVGTVLTSDEIMTAEQMIAKAKSDTAAKAKAEAAARAQAKAEAAAKAAAEAAAKAQAEAAAKAKAEADARAEAEAEANKKAESVQRTDYETLFVDEVYGKTVSYSADLRANGTVKENAQALGSFTLTFYCPCETCNGRDDGKTANGAYMVEGRTIAVDSSVIPLGSRVYIDGYGVFIAEDTGHAIVNNKIDVCVSTHERALELGVKSADVYLLS